MPDESNPKSVASVKAPTDPKYLKRVQINNEKPPVKNIAPPIHRSFVQVSSQIKLDLIADEAASVMTHQSQSQMSKVSSKTGLKIKNKAGAKVKGKMAVD